MKVIFDTDPGIDDAMALFYLGKIKEIDLIGITTVFGNGGIDTTTRNALFLKERFGLKAPIFRGAAQPLDGSTAVAATAVHGDDGLGNIEIPEDLASAPEAESAVDFIVRTIKENPGEITIIAVGRMTNLALALRADPSIAALTRQVIIMGGAFGYQARLGNITPAAEANIHGDPLAADEVFGAEWPVAVVGLDVTHDIVLDSTFLDDVAQRAGENGELLRRMSGHYADFYRDIMGIDGVVGHDLAAVTYAVHPEWFETRTGPIRVLCDGLAVGQTIQMPSSRKFGHPSWTGRRSQLVCTRVDAQSVLEHYRSTVIAA